MSEPREPLRPGEKVTLLLPDHVVQVEVTASMRDRFEVILSSRGAKTYVSSWMLDEEGISWLRGYHAADSQAIDACKVAQGLATKPEGQVATLTSPSVGGFGNAFVGGGVSIGVDKNVVKTWIEEVLRGTKDE